MTNKFFKGLPIIQLDYFHKYPQRRRATIVADKSYTIKDNDNENILSKMMYDSGKLNAFIKVVNDKFWIDNTCYFKEMKRPTSTGYVTHSFPYKPSEYLFEKIFLRGTFFAIEIFKSIISMGIESKGIKKIIFAAMPKELKEEKYIQKIPNTKQFKSSTGDFSVILSTNKKIIYVAMWEHALAYE